MATQYIKYAKKCRKIFFSKIIGGGGGMAPFGQGVATPMLHLHLPKTQLVTQPPLPTKK